MPAAKVSADRRRRGKRNPIRIILEPTLLKRNAAKQTDSRLMIVISDSSTFRESFPVVK
jgi:hypothetical protein